VLRFQRARQQRFDCFIDAHFFSQHVGNRGGDRHIDILGARHFQQHRCGEDTFRELAVGGSASDIDIEAREILRMRDRLNRIFSRETGQPLERIEEDTHRNFWLSAEAAQRYGLVGRIIERTGDLEA